MHHFQCLRPSSIENDIDGIENDAHCNEKLLLKTQVSEKFLHSEVDLIIQYVIVQYRDRQNNNIRICIVEIDISSRNWIFSVQYMYKLMKLALESML